MTLAMSRMPNATQAKCNKDRLSYSKMSCECNLITCIQIGIERQCSLYDAPSPVHGRRMNECKHASIRMLIEICPKTNHCKRISKREKEMGVGRHASHTRTLITTVVPSRRSVRIKATLSYAT